MWEIELDQVKSWLEWLSADDYYQVIAALELLQERGPQLGRPLVDRVKGVTAQEHEGASSRHERSIGGEDAVRVRP